MKIFNKKAERLIQQYIIATYQKVAVKAGECRYNYVCHLNTVHDAINANHTQVAMCLVMDGDVSYIHFVNVLHDGSLEDNTLGYWATKVDFYLVRYVERESFDDITDIFYYFQKELRKQLPWVVRVFNRTEF